MYRRAESTCLMFPVERNEWGRPAGVTQTNERLLGVCGAQPPTAASVEVCLIEDAGDFNEGLMDRGSAVHHTQHQPNCDDLKCTGEKANDPPYRL